MDNKVDYERYLTFKIETPGSSLLLAMRGHLWRYIFLKYGYNHKSVKLLQTWLVYKQPSESSEQDNIELRSSVNSEASNTYPVAIDINWNKTNTNHNKINTKAKTSVALGA